MKKMNKIIPVIAILFLGICSAQGQPLKPLPIDPQVRYGKLDNGLTYYIRHNDYPKNRAEFYIAQKVGSILEQENQRGLAHFLEHMAFNGTKNFPGKSLLEYLSRNGVKFGSDVNAYTGFDETVYNISNVPTTVSHIVDSCLLMLHDWSSEILLEDKEIDAERKVIQEEWRTRSNAGMRLWEKIIPVVFAGSQYADRMPIGTMDVVMNFKPSTLRDYYHKWYRPDLQGIIIVGDVNIDEVEGKIKQLFGNIGLPKNPAERIKYTVPDNDTPIIVSATDKENPNTIISVYYKHEPMPEKLAATRAGLEEYYKSSIVEYMLNMRLTEIINKANAPFLMAQVANDNFIVSNTKDAFTAMVLSKSDAVEQSFAGLLREMERVSRYGFGQGEYDRAKAYFMSNIEKMYNERNTISNGNYVKEYIDHFINGSPIPGIENEYALFKQIAQKTPLKDINSFSKGLIHDDNVVITVLGPEKENFALPGKEALLSLLSSVKQENIAQYVDSLSNKPLIEKEPVPGKIVSEKKNTLFNTTTWHLSNGATVILQPNKNKENEIIIDAKSKGGNVKYGNLDFANLKAFNQVVSLGGVGIFSATDLEKILAGKVVSISTSLYRNSESIHGMTTQADLKTFMQLLYLSFTQPRQDNNAFENWRNINKESLIVGEKNPNTIFRDSLNKALYPDNEWFRNMKSKDYDEINYDRVMQIYKERFADAADFTFSFVGDFNTDSIRPLVEEYVASLPSTGKKEKFSPSPDYIKPGKREVHFSYPMNTPKTTVTVMYGGKCKNTTENNIRLQMLDYVMDLVYTKSIREKEGGTYGVSSNYQINAVNNTCSFAFAFDTNKEQKDVLAEMAKKEFIRIVTEGPSLSDMEQAKKYLLKTLENQTKNNNFWSEIIAQKTLYGIDNYTKYAELVNKQTPSSLKAFWSKTFDKNNFVEVVMDGIKAE